MAIKPIRERVIKFFVDVYEEYFEIHFGEEESWDLLERTEPMVRYTMTELPEGYEEVEFMALEHFLRTEWRNSEGIGIVLKQETGTQEFTMDNKGNKYVQLNCDGLQIMQQRYEGADTFIWNNNEYTFYLIVYEKLSEEQITVMIKSLDLKK